MKKTIKEQIAEILKLTKDLEKQLEESKKAPFLVRTTTRKQIKNFLTKTL